MISLAVKKEVSWSIVSLFLEEISSTLVKSKQVTKILLKELENYAENSDKPFSNFFNDENQSKHAETSEIETFLEQSNEEPLPEDYDPQSDDHFIKSESEGTILEDILLNEEFDEEQEHTFFGNEEENTNTLLEVDEEYFTDAKEEIDFNPNKDKLKSSFKCESCGKEFRKRWSLKMHEKTHTDERPFKCQTCQKEFKQPSHLKNHEIIHTGDRPFKCETCKKAFKQISHLISHKKSHTAQ